MVPYQGLRLDFFSRCGTFGKWSPCLLHKSPQFLPWWPCVHCASNGTADVGDGWCHLVESFCLLDCFSTSSIVDALWWTVTWMSSCPFSHAPPHAFMPDLHVFRLLIFLPLTHFWSADQAIFTSQEYVYILTLSNISFYIQWLTKYMVKSLATKDIFSSPVSRLYLGGIILPSIFSLHTHSKKINPWIKLELFPPLSPGHKGFFFSVT